MRFLAIAILMTLSAVSPTLASDQIPGAAADKPIALVGGTVHTVSGTVIRGGAVLIDRGKIVEVGADVEIPEGTVWVDTEGLHIYPGLIESHSVLGLIEINAILSTADHQEVGAIKPNVRAEVAINPDSERLPTTRANGILLALSVPTGGEISGTSTVIHLDGWTTEDMTLLAPAGMHVRWPNMNVKHPDTKVAKQRKDQRDAALKRIRDTFDDARAYQKGKASGTLRASDLRLDAMLPVLDRTIPVFVHADEYRQTEAAVDWAVREKLQLVIVGGRDAWRSAEKLKAHGVPVIVQGLHRMPRRRWEGYDAAYTAPKRLYDAGVKFCIASNGDIQPHRNLPYHAAMAAAYGLPKEEALKSVTLHAADILGVGDRVGSIEVGKDATLIVTTGDPLEIRTHVTAAYVQGKPVDLTSRHTQLYEKYRKKYQQLGLIDSDADPRN
jgi:imidazolonepropionase-like amidohydrolase